MHHFTWVETFENISKWLLDYEDQQEYLIELLQKIGVEGGLEDKDGDGKRFLLKEIDPFTFMALILKYKDETRNNFLLKLNQLENLNLDIPKDYYGVPRSNAQSTWLFAYKAERKEQDIPLLWALFRSVHEKLEIAELFNSALEIKQTAIGSLSQMLFVLFPHDFFPIDKQTKAWLIKMDMLKPTVKLTWDNYKAVLDHLNKNLKASFPAISYTFWYVNKCEFNKENVEVLLAVRLNRITDGVQYVKGFENQLNKQMALQVDPASKFFNIILEDVFPDNLEIQFKTRIVGSANLPKNAPSLANKQVCVIRTDDAFGWDDFLKILDWFEGGVIMSDSMKNIHKPVNTPQSPKVLEPLNQILYGPPGTGKTYATTELAVKIAEPLWYAALDIDHVHDRREALKNKYNELIQKKQIAFTTFHQSFSYEDFIEGLKAYIPEEQDKVAYEVEDGIFKSIALAAAKSQGVSGTLDIGLNTEPKIWKISICERLDTARRKKYIDAGEARIGWNETGDLTVERNVEQEAFYNEQGSNNQSTLDLFSSKMQIGDVVLCLKDKNAIEAIGVVASNYIFDEEAFRHNEDYAHVRKVKWLAKDIDFNILSLNQNKMLTQKTVYEIRRMNWAKIVEELKHQNIEIEGVTTTELVSNTNHNYVLIMDEINRGNISKVFGELITLIEEDKRSGMGDERELMLPYCKELFSVPANLYLIGTMNTADKSLTQLDVALRRRFEFKEILPNVGLLNDANQYGVDVVKLLSIINKRIQCLKGKDYQIGHSYFMPLCEKSISEQHYLDKLQMIFKNKIIPLLQEYFFSNLAQIGLILNDNLSSLNTDRIVIHIDESDNLFPFAEPIKLNPLHCIEINMSAFNSLQRFKQVYGE